MIKYIGVLVIGILLGQKLMYMAYDPELLTERVLKNIVIVYTKGCTEGLISVNGHRGYLAYCEKMALDTVMEYENVYRSKMWNNDKWDIN